MLFHDQGIEVKSMEPGLAFKTEVGGMLFCCDLKPFRLGLKFRGMFFSAPPIRFWA